MRKGIHMRKIALLTVVALIVVATGMWIRFRTLAPADALAESINKPPAMMTGAKGLPSSLYDDYEIVVH
jgi:hypothetical protein